MASVDTNAWLREEMPGEVEGRGTKRSAMAMRPSATPSTDPPSQMASSVKSFTISPTTWSSVSGSTTVPRENLWSTSSPYSALIA
ncbi:MAG TPA: hypothetical protein VK217_04735 [Acidimicrobiales bacterium]|nr:hypothetical protein [Acidimicrobiales bacterium]